MLSFDASNSPNAMIPHFQVRDKKRTFLLLSPPNLEIRTSRAGKQERKGWELQSGESREKIIVVGKDERDRVNQGIARNDLL